MDRVNIINTCKIWITSHYNFRKTRIMDLTISDLDNWLKRIDSRWTNDQLDSMNKEDKANLLILEQHSEIEESVTDLIEVLRSSKLTDNLVKEKVAEILYKRDEKESLEEKEINDILYDELESL